MTDADIREDLLETIAEYGHVGKLRICKLSGAGRVRRMRILNELIAEGLYRPPAHPGHQRRKPLPPHVAGMSHYATARLLGISERTVRRARKRQAEENP